MKTKSILCTLGAIAALPVLSFAETTSDMTSPSSSAAGGVQKTPEQNAETGEIKERQQTADPSTDAPRLSPTNTQTGGAVDTGSPKDNIDKNPNVDHTTEGETAPR